MLVRGADLTGWILSRVGEVVAMGERIGVSLAAGTTEKKVLGLIVMPEKLANIVRKIANRLACLK